MEETLEITTTFDSTLYKSHGKKYLLDYFLQNYYKSGDIIRIARDYVYSWGMKNFKRDDVEDMSQEVLLGMLRKRKVKGKLRKQDAFDKFDINKGSFNNYIRSIIHHLVNNKSKQHINRSKKKLEDHFETIHEDVYFSFEQSRDDARFAQCVSYFRGLLAEEDADRPLKVPLLKTFDYKLKGWSNKRIAEREDISISRVHQQWSKIETFLKDYRYCFEEDLRTKFSK